MKNEYINEKCSLAYGRTPEVRLIGGRVIAAAASRVSVKKKENSKFISNT